MCIRKVKVFLAFMLTLTITTVLFGIETSIYIPGKNWHISFDAPLINHYEGILKDSGFRYVGTTDSNFTITAFVEPIKGTKHGCKACYSYYWPLASRNPLIDKKSIKKTERKNFVMVEYRIKGEKEGFKFDIPNINYYLEHDNKWIDVHISMFPYEEKDISVLNAFTESLKVRKNDG